MAKTKAPVELTTEIHEFTIEEANAILKAQGNNRPLKMSKVKQIAQDIVDGNFVLNGESIVFDSKGKLLDGQHRLRALVHAAERHNYEGTIKAAVVRGVERKLFSTFDQGEKRSLSDVVAMDGKANSPDVAVALRLLYIRLKGKKVAGTGKLNHQDSLKLLHKHPNLVEWADYVSTAHEGEETGLPIKSLVSPGYMAALSYSASLSYESSKVEEFLKALCDQNVDRKGCPAVALRKILLKNRADKNGKLKRDALVAFIVKAMIAYLEGEDLLKLSLKGNEYPLFSHEGPAESTEEASEPDADDSEE